MRDLNGLLEKQNLMLLGSLIKVNRIRQNMSQQHLAQGICVPSYLSKIENGEVVPSIDIIEALFDELDIKYYSDATFIREKSSLIDDFFDEMNLNGFVKSGEIFEQLVNEEEKFIHSPLIVEYYLVHFSKYCATPDRDKFLDALMMIQSIESLLTDSQRFKYYFYLGLDQLLYYRDTVKAKELLMKSTKYETTGHSYLYLAIAYYQLSSYYEAFESTEKAYQAYLDEGNLVGIIGLYQFKAMLCYKVGSVEQALSQYERALVYIKKLRRLEFVTETKVGQIFMLVKLNQIQEARQIRKELEGTSELIDLVDEWLFNHKTKHDGISLQMIRLCQSGDKTNLNELADLISRYKGQGISPLISDVLLYEAVIVFYTRNRMYKDAYLLTCANHL